MRKIVIPLLAIVVVYACNDQKAGKAKPVAPQVTAPVSEFSDVYTTPVKKAMYSINVSDSFTIFQSLPSTYNKDSAKHYPLVILLDANAFFEPMLANAKFNTFIGDMDECIITGVGYKNFPAMDSIRSRDYTYPKALPEYEMGLSGGAPAFKSFLDNELVPQLEKEYKIDTQKIILCGHSLGGYFTLYYLLKSAQENRFVIKNFISASPSLFYNNRYLFAKEDSIATHQKSMPVEVYISMGSRDMQDSSLKNILGAFTFQLNMHHYAGLKLRADEYTNFGHIDAALPAFAKGLSFVFGRW